MAFVQVLNLCFTVGKPTQMAVLTRGRRRNLDAMGGHTAVRRDSHRDHHFGIKIP